jgi:hypothetical protein
MSLAARSKFRSAQGKAIKGGAVRLPSLAGPPVYSSGIAASDKHVAVVSGE